MDRPAPDSVLPQPRPIAEVAAVFETLRAIDPEPKGELIAVNSYTLLVAVVLSAQATDASVNKATKPLFARIRTPEAMLDLGEAGLCEAIKSIGLYRTKARNVIALSKALIERHGGQVPDTLDALVSLAGVGRKTANVVLNMAFGAETFAVDTHVFRVSNRLRIAPGRSVEAVEAGLEARVPAPFRRHAHHWLILHGRYCCTARKPACFRCPLDTLCDHAPKTLQP